MTTTAKNANTSKRQQRRNQPSQAGNDVRQLISFSLTEQSKATGALFNIQESDRSENGPIMSGSLEIDGAKVPLCGFLKQATQSETQYLGLSLGEEGGIHYYGKLFRVTEKKSANAPDYTGFITVLACTKKDEHSAEKWEEAPTLKVAGWRKRNGDGSGRIYLVVSSREVSGAELAF